MIHLASDADSTAMPSLVDRMAQAFSADGILATAGNGEGLMRLWDVTTGELLVEFRTDRTDGPNIGSGWMTFSSDGSYLAYIDGDGVLRRYLMDTDQLIELAEARLTRGFTSEECQTYLDSAECASEIDESSTAP